MKIRVSNFLMMTDYIQVTFNDLQPEQRELLIALLSEAGYDGFEENENQLQAFVPEKHYDHLLLKELTHKYKLLYSEQTIASRNWNEVWESNFHPVIIDDFVGIRASFHPPIQNVRHEIVITPKMSFGTGHHATTSMMIGQMKDVDFIGKSVLDFGTGTGILAILAENKGATNIVAIDNDDWSIENARENIEQNNCLFIELTKTDSPQLQSRFDIILANINKNVILDNLKILTKQLNPSGVLLLSGLLAEDESDVVAESMVFQLKLMHKIEKDNWLCMRLSYG